MERCGQLHTPIGYNLSLIRRRGGSIADLENSLLSLLGIEKHLLNLSSLCRSNYTDSHQRVPWKMKNYIIKVCYILDSKITNPGTASYVIFERKL